MPPKGIPSYRPSFMGTHHMVSSGHWLASVAGLRILQEGGNAIDAGVASGIALNVTLPNQTSFAGVAPIILYRADVDEVVTISGLGRWPRAADIDGYRKRYGGDMPAGIPRSVVPAACDAWLTALELYGTMSFEQVVAPSVELAEQGFPVSNYTAKTLEAAKTYIEKFPSSAEIFMPNGRCLQPGQVLLQADLGRLFRRMVEVEKDNSNKGRTGAIRAARDFFYKGEVAEKMVALSRQQDGLLTMDDFSEFHVNVEVPEVGSYKEYTVYTCGPWCQGPSLIQVLHILEGFDLRGMGHNSAQYIHTLIEAVKLAFADRHQYYGDPDYVDVPMEGLLSKEYAKERRGGIDPERAWPEMPPAGVPWPLKGDGKGLAAPVVSRAGSPETDTSYTCVVDQWGNAFSATPSDGVAATPIVPGLGLIISDRGRQSWLEPEHPSRIGPWKRPRLTPNPAIAFKEGRLFMPFGAQGGDMQVQAMAQMFLNMVEFGMNAQQAVEEPRARTDSFPNSFWPHVYYPGSLSLEGRIDGGVAEKLEKLGHTVSWMDDWTPLAADLCGIAVDRERGILIGAADARCDNYAIGW